MSMKQKRLQMLEEQWNGCTACSLSANRTQVVFGHGNPDTRIMMIGEAPGKDEDEQGIPFVGKAGQLFDKILTAVDIRREDIWITNTCLCRPPENRNPSAKEIAACRGRLLTEIAIIDPSIIVLTGNIPLFAFTKKRGITKNRGWQDVDISIPTYATLHPASLLYGSTEQIVNKKKMVWEDWKEIKAKMDEMSKV